MAAAMWIASSRCAMLPVAVWHADRNARSRWLGGLAGQVGDGQRPIPEGEAARDGSGCCWLAWQARWIQE